MFRNHFETIQDTTFAVEIPVNRPLASAIIMSEALASKFSDSEHPMSQLASPWRVTLPRLYIVTPSRSNQVRWYGQLSKRSGCYTSLDVLIAANSILW